MSPWLSVSPSVCRNVPTMRAISRGPRWASVQPITQTSIETAATAIHSATVALSRIPTTLSSAKMTMPPQAKATT